LCIAVAISSILLLWVAVSLGGDRFLKRTLGPNGLSFSTLEPISAVLVRYGGDGSGDGSDVAFVDSWSLDFALRLGGGNILFPLPADGTTACGRHGWLASMRQKYVRIVNK
jgi:hypothetical protein